MALDLIACFSPLDSFAAVQCFGRGRWKLEYSKAQRGKGERNKISVTGIEKETPGIDWNARGKRAPRPNLERGFINGL